MWNLHCLPPPLLLLVAATFSSPSQAEPSIDISLQASFPAPPFLLELLETAAAENSSAYLPLLDRIATGTFANAATDKQLYDRFRDVLREDSHLSDEAALGSWDLALSVHEAAPRIEAGYQFYRTSVVQTPQSASQAVELWEAGKGLCPDYECMSTDVVALKRDDDHITRHLQFDRVHGDILAAPLRTLYVDITSPDFGVSYREWRTKNIQSTVPFRVRYKSSNNMESTPLVVSGYGVELALKRTDYIVIDDRDAEEKDQPPAETISEVKLQDSDDADVKSLSSSELYNLGFKTADFIMASEEPFDTLTKVTQDFPKHAAALALHNISRTFLREHHLNRDILLTSGYNVLWVNGMQVDTREVNAFSLLELLRRERKLISNTQELGLTPPEAISLLSHPRITEAQANGEPQRYDFRDETEGGNVILWLNNIEKDRRYKEWPKGIAALLQRTYPGQLPAVRKDVHNVIFPVDLSDRRDVTTVVEQLQFYIKRMLAVRFGIVPIATTQASKDHAAVMYHLEKTYGLSAVMDYMAKSVLEKKLSAPSKAVFEDVIQDRMPRRDQEALPFAEVLKSTEYQVRIHNAHRYLTRLGADGANAPIFANGVAIPRTEEWLQGFNQRMMYDMRFIQRQVYEEKVDQSSWLAGQFLKAASLRRNPLIIPEDEKNVKLFDVGMIYREYAEEIANSVHFRAGRGAEQGLINLCVIADFASVDGAHLVGNATLFAAEHDDVAVAFIHHSSSSALKLADEPALTAVLNALESKVDSSVLSKDDIEHLRHAFSAQQTRPSSLARSLGLLNGSSALLLNGRLVGPVPSEQSFTKDDFESLLNYERKKRISPTIAAVEALNLSDKINHGLALAKLSSLVALSTVSDVPEGIFDSASGPRLDLFNNWTSSYTCIERGDKGSASVQLVASLDPASEIAQRWVPILGVLSQLNGVHMRIFLNPREKLQELPIKRFYRHVLLPKPQFSEEGGLADLHAEFMGIPKEVLLTTTMDVPPSWVVAPQESIHDLDNIKLSSLKGSSNIEAIYELEYILIEGHSRDTTTATPPRGVQLVLGTENNANFAGTIIMANLGYFQFKANPGVFSLELQEGRSRQIFSLDSAGTLGYAAKLGDNTTEISLVSFKGATVFPRLSRKQGHEDEDVLEMPQMTAADFATRGADLADAALAKIGLSHIKTGPRIAKGLDYVQRVLTRTGLKAEPQVSRHADINIFSVASGHLYERMLNIMMVSVMRHTNHTVKFWFIEQFLSPSFKTSLPTIAAEYKFDYEMVTYKWPHWLRAQKEKQRVIWGYKILFLDVLFPLDLDKVIFVDADQIVRTDMYELVSHDLRGAPYGFTPMCDSREEMEGFRFWKQGYWKTFLRGLPYHISALYVVDLIRFRQMAAGDRLRQQYHTLSADPGSLSNLDQDLPNHMQALLPIHSLPQEWLWCETWCDDESLKTAKTIDLCNNPLTKEPKLERARRQVPEWMVYDNEISEVLKRNRTEGAEVGGQGDDQGIKGEVVVDKEHLVDKTVWREL